MAFWRDSGRPVRFFMVDGRAAWAIVLLLVNWSITTLAITLLVFAVLVMMEQFFGYNLPNAKRRLRILFWGKNKRGVSWWRTHKF